ncbi:MAG: hypothetical protein RL456_1421 [Pseudomonadota bacterium]|jgi:hypothetical protein
MTLQQLQHFKRWHVCHHHGHTVELAVCDLVLGAWVAGWALLLTLLALDALWLMPLSLGLTLAPSIYVRARRSLHRRGRLRCDWLEAVRPQKR